MKMLVFLLFLTLKGSLCELAVKGTSDKAAIVGHNVTINCSITNNGVDIFSANQPFTLFWLFTPVGSQVQDEIVKIQFVPGDSPKLLHIVDAIKFVWSVNSASLTIRDVEFSDAGVYSCKVKDNENEKDAVMELFVLDKPQCHNLKPPLDLVSRNFDKQAFFDCIVHYGGTKPPSLLWKHDERELNTESVTHNLSHVSATLSFRADLRYNGYKFQCQASYPDTGTTLVCETSPPLEVYFPVHLNQVIIVPHAERYVYQAGNTINLYCRASGNPQPKYRWSFRPKGDNFNEVTLATEPSYKITDAQSSDEGIYNCTVTNIINGTSYIDSRTRYIQINDDGDDGVGGYRYVIIQSKEGDPVPNEEEEEKKSKGVSPYAIGAITCGVIAVILILVLFILAMKFRDQCFLIQMRKKPGHERLDLDENMDDQEAELLDESVQSSSTDEPQYGRLKLYWEIPRKDIRMIEQIGTGSYVEVWKGKMKKYPDSSEIQKVAIKRLKDNANEKERKFFLREMEVQKMIQPHPNVVLLIGCYTFHEPWLLMLEIAQEGTLYSYLQQSRPGSQEVDIKSHSVRHKNINSHRLLAIAAQVVNGLMHLLKFKLIYYRLKTSSVLVGRGGICKLSGFGFPHEVKERNEYEEDSKPLGWMAPECIKEGVYTYRTDIWSYGVLVWEIVHLGLVPYQGVEPSEIKNQILSGQRLNQPAHVSDQLYHLMLGCWREDPMNRTEYADILQELSNLASEHSKHILMNSLPEACRLNQAV